MISAISSLTPYSYTPPTLNKPAGQEGSDATTKSGEKPSAATATQKSATSTPQAQKDPKAAQEQRQIDQLQKTDRHVRAHEQAHLAAAGGLAMSGASFTYRQGPDGKEYAVAGEVQIDVSPAKTPQETLTKAERIKAAALAPSDPSAQDRAVAAQATQMAREAQIELSDQKFEQSTGKENATGNTIPSEAKHSASPSTIQRGIAGYRATSNTAAQSTDNHFRAAA